MESYNNDRPSVTISNQLVLQKKLEFSHRKDCIHSLFLRMKHVVSQFLTLDGISGKRDQNQRKKGRIINT